MKKLVIDANKKSLGLDIKELIHYKDLFLILAYRDLRVRYAQTFLGLTWAIIQPVAKLLILILVFGVAVKVDTGGVPYPLFAISGLAMWNYFGFVLNNSGNSIITAQEMVKKIYFPRLVIPLSKAVVGFVDFAIVLLILIVFMITYQYVPSPYLWAAPVFILLNIIAALAVGIWASALSIRYRDFQHVIPFLVQFGLYATPVAYPARLVPEGYQWIYNLNPMAGIIEGFRWSVLGGDMPSIYVWISFVVVVLLFVSGLLYFRKMEDTMADIV